MRRPTIGVVDQGTEKVQHYVERVERYGGRATVLRWQEPRDPVSDARAFDGLVLCGGDDLPGRYFDEPDHPEITLDHPDRDAYELAFCLAATERAAPLLAICRGVQVLNVALGGSVEQHIPDTPGRAEHRDGVLHALDLPVGTRLAALADDVGHARPRVNSYHHQAVGRVAPSLRVAAATADGAVEAVEGGGPFCVGVQWHPERDGNDAPFGPRLFEALIRACRGA